MTDMWTHSGKKRPDFAVEPGPGQESVWDYPRPPALEPVGGVVEVRSGDQLIARSTNALYLKETASPPTCYIEPDTVDREHLVEVAGRSYCEWKGEAKYLALASAPEMPVAWFYPTPKPRYEALANWLSFYPGRVACYVAGERVRAQSGGFYGGWITDAITGPFKGEAGTGHW